MANTERTTSYTSESEHSDDQSNGCHMTTDRYGTYAPKFNVFLNENKTGARQCSLLAAPTEVSKNDTQYNVVFLLHGEKFDAERSLLLF